MHSLIVNQGGDGGSSPLLKEGAVNQLKRFAIDVPLPIERSYRWRVFMTRVGLGHLRSSHIKENDTSVYV